MARSEIEVAADTVAALLSAGVIASHTRAAAASAAGLMPGDLEAAIARQRARGFIAPRRVDTTDKAETPVPMPPPPTMERRHVDRDTSTPRPGGNRGGGAPARQPAPTAKEFPCGRCGVSKPVDEFAFRTDRPGMRWTVCTPCRRQRSADRYFSVDKEKALGQARLEFTVLPGDDIIGLACTDCGFAFVAGDVVKGTASITHARECKRQKSSA